MTPATDLRLRSRAQAISQTASLATILVGGVVLIGWMFNVAVLKSILPTWVAMKANTAFAFVLAGLALSLQREGTGQHARHIAQVCAGMVALIGLLTLSEYVIGWNLGIDQALFREAAGAVATSHPGRMAPNTALSFLLVGLAFLLMDVETRRGHRPSQWLILTAGLVALLATLGYLYGVTEFYGIAAYTKMALSTALSFDILCLGILCARPDRGLIATIMNAGTGGVMARRFLLPAMLLPPTLGWLRLMGEQRGFYSTEFGLALFATMNIVVFAMLIFATAKLLHRVDMERNRFFTTSLDLFCVAGFDGYFKELNPRWETTLGFTIQELLASPFMEFIHPDDRERTQAEAQRQGEGRQALFFENRYRCKDGSYRWFVWNAIPDTERRLIYAVARDVTERKQLEEQLQHHSRQLEVANQELEAFSYSVSHDLRAPLRGIDGFSQALLEDYGEQLDAQGKDYLQRVRSGTQRMAQLIDDLLNLSRVARSEMRRERVNLSALAHAIAQELQKAQPDRQAELVITPGLVAEGDGRLMRVALTNLLSNAWKFTVKQSHPKIEVGTAQQDGQTVYFVRDNGAGFDMAYVGKLFGAFQRLHTAAEFAGTGIGLATVQRIIHRHGGRVWAEGAVEKGATFYFTL